MATVHMRRDAIIMTAHREPLEDVMNALFSLFSLKEERAKIEAGWSSGR